MVVHNFLLIQIKLPVKFIAEATFFSKTEYLPSLGPNLYTKEMNINICTKIHTQMFTTDLFMVGKNGKLPKCPSTDDWIN